MCGVIAVAYCGNRLNRNQENKRTYTQWGPIDPSKHKLFTTVSCYPPELEGKTLLLKTLHIHVIGHGEIVALT